LAAAAGLKTIMEPSKGFPLHVSMYPKVLAAPCIYLQTRGRLELKAVIIAGSYLTVWCGQVRIEIDWEVIQGREESI